jgi:hypothetical protein
MVFESDYKELRKHLHKVVHVQAVPSIEFITGLLYKVSKKFIKVLIIVTDNYAGMVSVKRCELRTITKYNITKLNYPDEYEHEIYLDEFEEVTNIKNFYRIEPAFQGYSVRKKEKAS